jgi:hypothetical protein
MLGSGLRSAPEDEFRGETSKRSWPAQDGEARQLEPDDNLTSADAGEPQLASHPLPVRTARALPRQRVLPATTGLVRLRPSHRSHARDGPRSKPAARPTTRCSGATARSPPLAPRVPANHHVGPSAGSEDPQYGSVGAKRSTTTPSSQPEPNFFTPRAASVVAFWWNRDTLPLWAKAAPSAATNTTGAGTARRRPGDGRRMESEGEKSQDLFAVVNAVALDGWELNSPVGGATCSSLLRAKQLPSTLRELRMCVGEVAVEDLA